MPAARRRFAAAVKSPITLEPETSDVRASGLRHAVGLGVDLELLQVAGTCGILYAQGGLDSGQPAVQ